MAFARRGAIQPSLEEELMDAVNRDLTNVGAQVGLGEVGGQLAQTVQSPTGRRTPRTSVRGSAREGVLSAPTPSPVRVDLTGGHGRLKMMIKLKGFRVRMRRKTQLVRCPASLW